VDWSVSSISIGVYHHLAGAGEREVLYYHTERSDCQVRYGIESDEEIRDDQVVTSIEPSFGN
jgi:hypothetical protein